MDKKIKLGVAAKDKVTGFKGIIIGHAKWLTGCDQWCIKPKVNKYGADMEGEWIDEGYVEVTGEGLNKKDVKAKKNGGPRKDTPKA